jgi:hypothetical protein
MGFRPCDVSQSCTTAPASCSCTAWEGPRGRGPGQHVPTLCRPPQQPSGGALCTARSLMFATQDGCLHQGPGPAGGLLLGGASLVDCVYVWVGGGECGRGYWPLLGTSPRGCRGLLVRAGQALGVGHTGAGCVAPAACHSTGRCMASTTWRGPWWTSPSMPCPSKRGPLQGRV